LNAWTSLRVACDRIKGLLKPDQWVVPGEAGFSFVTGAGVSPETAQPAIMCTWMSAPPQVAPAVSMSDRVHPLLGKTTVIMVELERITVPQLTVQPAVVPPESVKMPAFPGATQVGPLMTQVLQGFVFLAS